MEIAVVYVLSLKHGKKKISQRKRSVLVLAPKQDAVHTKDGKILHNIPNQYVKKLFAVTEQNSAYMLSNY